jgi:hypothetical protein
VTSQKILEAALRDGIKLVSEPLQSWINYQKSGEKLFNEHPEDPAKISPASSQIVDPGGFESDFQSDPDDPNSRTIEEPGREERTEEELAVSDFERGYQPEILEPDEARNGE